MAATSNAISAAELIARTLEHKPGGIGHDQRSHGRWAVMRRAAKAAEEIEQLRQSIATAQTRSASRREPAVTVSSATSTASPSRMTKGGYTRKLKGEHVRLLMLDGKSEKEAKALARPAASIDELKDRNSALRRKLRAAGVDYRTDEQKRDDDTEKNALLDEVERLAVAGGHDGATKRAGAAKMTPRELRKFIADVKDYQARQAAKAQALQQGPVAETAWRAAEDSSRASSRQVGYIMGLLKRRGGNSMGEGGFMVGPTTKEEVARMSKSEASAYINSLTGDY